MMDRSAPKPVISTLVDAPADPARPESLPFMGGAPDLCWPSAASRAFLAMAVPPRKPHFVGEAHKRGLPPFGPTAPASL